MDVADMLSNAAVASQMPLLTDDEVVVGALLRSIAQWIESNDEKGRTELLIDLYAHPQYES